MNSMEYEYDSVGGLMPQILALTAAPGSREEDRSSYHDQGVSLMGHGNGQTKSSEAGLAAHPYFRRPGRGHNHDCCDSCSEGGDLICCDLCPASFHLACHDPPLDEDELPTGDWACHQCKMGGNKDEETSNSSVKSTRSTKGVKRKDREDMPFKKDDKKVCAGGREFEISDTPLATLIKAAATMNPTQFALPYEMILPIPFPGEPKDCFKRNGSRIRVSKKKPYELDNGLVPLPARLCFHCRKSCRVGPMLPCDYCPLYFHLDCLNPPLTTPPLGRWMCPNHPEQYVDTNLLTSHSLTERVKLWDKFSVPVDQDTIKINFFQRCHRANPPFRYKLKRALRSRIRVPPAIKRHYKDPPDLLPRLASSYYLSSAQEVLSSNPVCPSPSNNLQSADSNVQSLPDDFIEDKCNENYQETIHPTKEEKDQWLSCLLGLQSSIIKHMSSSESIPPKDENCNESTSESKPTCINGNLISHDSKVTNHIKNSQMLTSIYKKKAHLKSKLASSSTTRPRSNKSGPDILMNTLLNLQVSLKEKLTFEKDLCVSELEQSVIETLAYERLKEIMEPEKPEVVLSTPPLSARALVCPLVPDIKLKDLVPKHKKYSVTPVPMTYRTLTIGKGSQTNVNLEDYGHCNYISKFHGSITFDENTGHYELLNYSEYSTKVDGVSYYCGFNENTVSGAVIQPVVQQVKDIINKRRLGFPYNRGQSSTDSSVMTNTPDHNFIRCECRLNEHQYEEIEIGGWEGSAILHHGSYLRFGCIKFVFSIVEDASNGDWAADAETIYKKFLLKEDEERKQIPSEITPTSTPT